MTSKPIIVLAGLRVKDGSADDFIKLATPIVAATRKEPGCVKYEFLQDVLDKQIFYFYEEYADRPKREQLLDRYLGVRVLSERFIS